MDDFAAPNPPTTTEGAGRSPRRRAFPLIWLGSIGAASLLVLGVSGSLAGWTAAITNSQNNAGTTRAPILLETGPGSAGTPVTCQADASTAGAYTCATINKYGAGGLANLAMKPGDSKTTVVTLKNTSTTAASTFNLGFGTCTNGTQGAAPGTGNLCTDDSAFFTVAVICLNDATTPVSVLTINATKPGSLTATNALTGGLAAGATVTCTFTTALDSSAPISDAGLTASQPMTWTLTM
jgi:hypothetical protein